MSAILRSTNSLSRVVCGAYPVSLHQCLTAESRRFSHNDVDVPSFNKYRNKDTLDPYKSAKDTEDARRGKHNFLFYGVGGTLALISAREVVSTIVTYKSMSADQLALASIEVNLEEVPEGQTKTYEWRGKPVFVRHRTRAEIEKERQVNVADLRDPQTDEERVKKDEWSVVIGVCTHLGCIPFAGLGDYGGYYCPCHGSHYDGSGRIRKGPAPRNLDVPAYKFVNNDKTVVVGSS